MTGPGEDRDQVVWWQFYCWRCEQWCERRGLWCQLYAAEPLNDPCKFDQWPAIENGVPWWPAEEDSFRFMHDPSSWPPRPAD